jgi:hypothetical protein
METALILVPRSVYGFIRLINSMACFCVGLGVVMISKVGAFAALPGVRQVLRTIACSCAINV